jgi:hypothetical protein
MKQNDLQFRLQLPQQFLMLVDGTRSRSIDAPIYVRGLRARSASRVAEFGAHGDFGPGIPRRPSLC